MIKLTEIDTLLALPYNAVIQINNQDAFYIREIARYYGSEVDDNQFLITTVIRRNDITLILYSKPKQL